MAIDKRNKKYNTRLSFKEFGRLGGEAPAEKDDFDFYEEIGQKGGEARARKHKNKK